jgi:hypothetical protein
MANKRHILTVTLLIAILGITAWFLLRPDPKLSYQGRQLDSWLDDCLPSAPPPAREKATEAVRHIGTNAVPTLVRMLRQKDSKFKLRLIQLIQMQHWVHFNFESSADRHLEAMSGIAFLGPEAKSAVPALLEIYNEHRTNYYDSSLTMAQLIANMGPAAADAVPQFVQATTDANFQIRFNAVNTLAQIHARPDLSVPALTRSLRDPDETVRGMAALCLADFGTNARSALPELTRMLADPDSDVRAAAAEALKEIKHATSKSRAK